MGAGNEAYSRSNRLRKTKKPVTAPVLAPIFYLVTEQVD
jgi:hypothetical protein